MATMSPTPCNSLPAHGSDRAGRCVPRRAATFLQRSNLGQSHGDLEGQVLGAKGVSPAPLRLGLVESVESADLHQGSVYTSTRAAMAFMVPQLPATHMMTPMLSPPWQVRPDPSSLALHASH